MATPTILYEKPLFPLVVFLVLLIAATLSVFAILFKQSDIETDLLQRTRQALSEAGLPADGIRFQGRDGILSGAVVDENVATQLENTIRQVYGVRNVENRVEIAQTAAIDAASIPQTPPPAAGLYIPSKKHPVEQIDLSAIQFDYARAELEADSMSILENISTELQKSPQMKIEVSAHTDDSGTALGKMAVTQARAEAIRTYLLSKGIHPEQVKAQGYGSVRPVADNNTDEGRQQNRRIEITVLEE